MSHPPDNFKLCESCNVTHDDSQGREDEQSGLWFCDSCWDRLGTAPFETIDYAANMITPPSYFHDRI